MQLHFLKKYATFNFCTKTSTVFPVAQLLPQIQILDRYKSWVSETRVVYKNMLLQSIPHSIYTAIHATCANKWTLHATHILLNETHHCNSLHRLWLGDCTDILVKNRNTSARARAFSDSTYLMPCHRAADLLQTVAETETHTQKMPLNEWI